MTTGVLSIPFRLTPDGSIATVEHGSDSEVDEAIAALILTQVGERPMSPEYGVPDPTYAGLYPGDIQVGLNEYGPRGVSVVSVEVLPANDTQAIADVQWTYDQDGAN